MKESMESKKRKAREAIREQARGKVAVCPGCNRWFENFHDRNAHRASCPKRKRENA